MPITSSAIKAFRASKKKRIFNLHRKNATDKLMKQFRKFISEKNRAEAEKLVSSIYKALDKSAKTGQIKANTASRLKSRVMNALKKVV